MKTTPPLAEWILQGLLRTPDKDYILGDLAEQHARLTKRTNRFRAGLWYWRQVIHVLVSRIQGDRSRTSPAIPHARERLQPNEVHVMESVRQDVRFAIRQLRRQPGFAVTVTLTLALGIGANTAIFSVIKGTLLEPLPYPDPERLVYISSRLERADIPATHVSSLDFWDIHETVSGLNVSGIDETVVLPLTVEDRSRNVVISRTSWNFFDVIGVPPQLGRTFSSADGRPVGHSGWRPMPLVISDHIWNTWFGGTLHTIGRSVRINGFPAEIIGVMPPDFAVHLPSSSNIGADIDVWWPDRADYSTGSRDTHWLRVVGRVALNSEPSQVVAELDALADRLQREHQYNRQVGTRFDLVRLHDGVVGPFRSTLLMFLGAVGFVLVISCANVANLLMARATGRSTELAVRRALGAGRARIVRQVLTESAVLSIAGALAGIFLAIGGVEFLKSIAPADLPRVSGITIDRGALGFTLGIATLATLLYGVAPALQHARVEGSDIVQSRTTTAGMRQRGIQTALAVGEVALSIILLTGAALMVRTFKEMQQVPLGFETDGLVTFSTNTLPACPWADGGFQCTLRDIEENIERTVAEQPGVTSTGVVFPLPFNGVYDRIAEYTPDAERADRNARREAYFRTASPGYFETMGIDLLAGRALRPADNDTLLPVVVVDELLARTEWPGENPIGRRLALFDWGFDRPEAYEVVGVVEHVPQLTHRDRRPTMYLARAHYRSVEVSMAIRVNSRAATIVPAVRDAVRSVSPDLPVEFVQMEDLIARSMVPTKFVLTLLSIFSTMALVLAIIGLYGVLAFGVRMRTREIGIRIAFGANRSNVVRHVMKRGIAIAAAGGVFGLAGAMALGGLLERHLFGVSARDPLSLVVTTTLVLVSALLASYLPARRASRVHPLTALRIE